MGQITNRQAICDVLIAEAEKDKDIVVLCSDSRGSASMTPFFKAYPEQSVELGIAEQNLVSVAAGLAANGKKAFAVSPAAFLSTRSYEQVKVDVAYSGTNVKLIGVSGGISYGALGMSHHACQDIAALCAIPGMRVYLPSDRFQTAKLIHLLLQDDMPAYVRVSRSASIDIYDENIELHFNKAHVLSDSGDVLLVACGEMVARAKRAAELLVAEGISCSLVDMYCLKPFDAEAVVSLAKKAQCVVTLEEHGPFGGLGSITAQVLGANCPKPLLQIALPDEHLIPGSMQEMFSHYGMDEAGIAKKISAFYKEN